MRNFQPERPRSFEPRIHDQLDREARREKAETERLVAYTRDKLREVRNLTETQLRAATTLENSPQAYAQMMGSMARHELQRRGIKL